jgi:hypothetical protein
MSHPPFNADLPKITDVEGIMADAKTKPTDQSVMAFLEGVENVSRRQDCLALLDLMKDVTGAEPIMWGTSIVGFGSYHYKGKSGREGDWFPVGFSPRKQNLTLYLMGGLDQSLLSKFGKHKTGKGCIYVNKLADIDLQVLREMVKKSLDLTAK